MLSKKDFKPSDKNRNKKSFFINRNIQKCSFLIGFVFFLFFFGVWGLGGFQNAFAGTLTIDAAPTNGGNVSPATGTIYADDEGLAISVTVNSGWAFVNWTGPGAANLESVNSPTTTIKNPTAGDTAVTANFEKIDYSLTLAVSPQPEAGTAISTNGLTSYNYDSQLEIQATANPGWAFVNWTGPGAANLESVNSPTTTIKNPTAGDTAVTANFEKIDYTLTIDVASGNGSVSPMTGTQYNYDSGLIITATPSHGWEFVNWTGPGAANLTDPNSPTTTIFNPIFSNIEVYANFQRRTFTLTLSKVGVDSVTAGPGSISLSGGGSAPDSGTVTFNYLFEDEVTLTATPSGGSIFRRWEGSPAGAPAVTTITITGDQTAIGVFGYTITSSANDVAMGSISPYGVQEYDFGATPSYGIAPAVGHCIVDVQVDGEGSIPEPQSGYTFPPLERNRTISAVFRPQYTATVTIGPAAANSNEAKFRLVSTAPAYDSGFRPSGEVIAIPCGIDTVNVEFNDTQCWQPPSEEVTWHFPTDGNMDLSFGYTQKTMTLTMQKEGIPEDSVSPTVGTHEYMCGEEAILAAYPAEGSEFKGWTGEGVLDPKLTETKVVMTEDRTIKGFFTLDIWSLNMAVQGNGSVDPAPGTYGYAEGQEVTISAVPNTSEGWVFSQWLGLEGTLDLSGTPVDLTADSVTFQMHSDKDIVAVFILADQPDVDNDGDGFTENGGDCNDFDASIHPGADEICGDLIDQDCDGVDKPCDTLKIDNDFDGFTVDGTGIAPYFLTGVDCNDDDPAIHPGADEICGDGIDQDCDGVDLSCTGNDLDMDGDGFTTNMGDCNDGDSSIYPGAYDDPSNSINEDCYDGVRLPSSELTCVDIANANTPLETQIKAANANIMILLDDSGSMDWEVVTGQSDGLFYGNYYVFDDTAEDNNYSWGDQTEFTEDERRQWESQWSDVNKMYYNPFSTYDPWPGAHEILGYGDENGNAPMVAPRSNPALSTPTFNLDEAPYLVLKGQGLRVTLTREAGDGDSTCADAVKFEKVGGAYDGTVVIADNENSSGFTTTGAWSNSSGDYGYDPILSGFSNNNSERHSIYSNTTGSIATWTPELPEPGQYKIYVSWTYTSQRARHAPYRIYDNSGNLLETVEVDQRTTAYVRKWKELGTYNFTDVALAGDREIHRAHYYFQKGGRTYLTELDGGIHIYEFNDTNGNNRLDFGEIPPKDGYLSEAEAKSLEIWPKDAFGNWRTYEEERQNFANWYSYYRRRILTAKAAVGKVIAEMNNVNIGVHTIWARINQPAIPVALEDDFSDTTKGKGKLLSLIYDATYPNPRYIASGGTPLRMGLKRIGQYFDDTDLATGGIGNSPYVSFEEGGGCQQSFSIVMTDGYWNGSDSPAVGDADADGVSNTLADVAMHYYNKDLSDLTDLVPTHGLDLNQQQHMVTFGVSFGVSGTLPINYCSDSQPEECAWVFDPTSASATRTKIDDLLHAARNGRGDFLSAESPDMLVDALNAIKQKIEARIGTGASVAISSQELQTGTVLFQGVYDASDWTGDIKAYELVSQEEAAADPSLTVGALKSTPKWSAQTQLDSHSWPLRQIITWNGTNGVAFNSDAVDANNLNTQLLPYLDANIDIAKEMIDFIRGEAENEEPNGLRFRSRAGKLGDIVHSAPVKKDGVLYVGANDGMLHAFDTESGDEIFAYVPRLVFQNLNKLTLPEYTHTYFVDNSPYLGKVGSRTYLVGGLGKGGKGYFCLDVTSPANAEINANSIVKWEYPNPTITPDPDDVYDPMNPYFADSDWADLGYSFSRAFIFDSNAGVPIVVFGNGYDSYNKKAVLFILNAQTGQVLAKIDTGAGGWGNDESKDTDDDQCNGLSTPVLIDDDLDGKVDYAYAGDLLGNLWKFDLTANSANLWKVAYGSAGDPQPLFVAKNREGHRQPITTQPDIMYHCRSKNYGYLVIFGTGRYLSEEDFTDNSVQSLYGIWDWAKVWERDGEDPTSQYLGEFTASRELSNLVASGINATLLEQTQIYYGSFFGENFGIISNNEINWYIPKTGAGNHVGWFFDYPASAERTVRDVTIRDNIAVVVSSIPSSSPCSSGGYSYLTEMNACNGGRTIDAQFDVNDDGVIDSRDMVAIGSSAKSEKSSLSRKEVQGMPHAPAVAEIPGSDIEVKYFSNSDGSVIPIKEKKIELGMSSWRELEGK